MGNLGGGEIVVILLAALLILGPNKLPDAARQLGRAMGEIRKVTSGFQRELQDAMKDATGTEAEARSRGEAIAATRPTPAVAEAPTSEAPASQAPASEAPASEPPAAPAPPAAAPQPGAPVSVHDAAAQIPPAPSGVPSGGDVTVAPGSDN